AVASLTLLPQGQHHIGSESQVAGGQGFVGQLRGAARSTQVGDEIVVDLVPGDGVLENGWIRCYAGEPIVADHGRKLAFGDEIAANVIEPEALAVAAQCQQWVWFHPSL